MSFLAGGVRRRCRSGIYVNDAARGRGIGTTLMRALIEHTDATGIWTLQAPIFPENTASLALPERHGFRIVGRRVRIVGMAYGPWGGQWRDTFLLERRSTVSDLKLEVERGRRSASVDNLL